MLHVLYSVLFGTLRDLLPKFDFLKKSLFFKINSMRKSWPRGRQSFNVRPSIGEANAWELLLLWAQAWHSGTGHLPLLSGLIESRADTWAFPESTACSPWRAICRTCMHHWHSKIKIFPLPGTQRPLHTRPLCNWALFGDPKWTLG